MYTFVHGLVCSFMSNVKSRITLGASAGKTLLISLSSAFVFAAGCVSEDLTSATDISQAESSFSVPEYQVDPFWPKPLPNNWILGQVGGIAVDDDDHIWIVQRPRTVDTVEGAAAQNPPRAECCVPAPSIIEFDQDGNMVSAWGGPTWNKASSEWVEPPYIWPANEHGIYVDDDGNVWTAGNAGAYDPPDGGESVGGDHIVLKMSPTGDQLLVIGRVEETGGSNDPERLGRPADMYVDTEANEVYIADGYGNRRVIVFDSETGEYKRHWGSYGEMPHDLELPAYHPDEQVVRSYRGPVHAVVMSNDGLLYVGDRNNNRIQVFEPDGAYVTETYLAKRTYPAGSIWDLDFSADSEQRWLIVADGSNRKIRIVDRSSLVEVSSFGRGGRQAGQFDWVHNVAVDSDGNIYTAEVRTGKRVQKFDLQL